MPMPVGRRFPPATLALRLPVLLAVSALLAACEPRDTSPGSADPAGYVHAVCAGLRDWQQGIATDTAQLAADLGDGNGDDLDGLDDLDAVEAVYGQYYTSVGDRTDTLLGALEQAGAPRVPSGNVYAEKLRGAVAEARTGAATAQEDLSELPKGDPERYAAAAARIRDAWGKVLLRTGTTFTELNEQYDSAELDTAIAEERACEGMV